jgi:hypothetical protein
MNDFFAIIQLINQCYIAIYTKAITALSGVVNIIACYATIFSNN